MRNQEQEYGLMKDQVQSGVQLWRLWWWTVQTNTTLEQQRLGSLLDRTSKGEVLHECHT